MWEENKKIREMCNQFSVKLCKQVDISQHTFMKIAKDWFISRKRRIIADIKCLQKEGSQMDKDASDGSYSSHTSDTGKAFIIPLAFKHFSNPISIFLCAR
jgi:hypothetical protein